MKTRILTSLATLVLGIGALTASAQPDIRFERLSPNPAPADQRFKLTVRTFECNTYYTNQTFSVQGSDIRVSHVARELPRTGPVYDTLCGGYSEFQATPLKPGEYTVILSRLIPCHLEGCKVGIRVDSVGVLKVGKPDPIPDPKIEYVINPESTPAKQDFVLELLSHQFNCGTTFSFLSSHVQGSRIDLTFIDKQNPLVKCIDIYKAYGPSFKIGALAAGEYQVYANRMPECAAQGCLIAPIPVLAGTLKVTGDGAGKDGWFINPAWTMAQAAFKLRILSDRYGNCQTSFAHTNLTMDGTTIYASFLVENHPERVCITDIRPHGPTFEMPALKAGVYPVYVVERAACEFEQPFCAVRLAPKLVDTLFVSMTLSVLKSELAHSPAARWSGSRLSMTLPAGPAGTWRFAVVGADGRESAEFTAKARGGEPVELTAPKVTGMGRYLRVTSPDGSARALRLERTAP